MQPVADMATHHLVLIRFVGDTETGVVHYADGSCPVSGEEAFLDLRTAIVRGYRLCGCCRLN